MAHCQEYSILFIIADEIDLSESDRLTVGMQTKPLSAVIGDVPGALHEGHLEGVALARRPLRVDRGLQLAERTPNSKTQGLTLVANQKTCSIYVNGELAKSFQGVSLMGERESIRGCSIILGNSREVKSPWTGSILALRLYERALSEREIEGNREGMTGSDSREGLIASFALAKSHGTSIPDLSGNKNTLSVPGRVTMTNPVLAWPDWRNQKDSSPAGDIVVNILGFVPIGFLFTFWRERAHGSGRWAVFLLAVLVGALISLAIEVTQAFIPASDSCMVDVICNTAETGIGVLHTRSLRSLEAQGLWDAHDFMRFSREAGGAFRGAVRGIIEMLYWNSGRQLIAESEPQEGWKVYPPLAI